MASEFIRISEVLPDGTEMGDAIVNLANIALIAQHKGLTRVELGFTYPGASLYTREKPLALMQRIYNVLKSMLNI